MLKGVVCDMLSSVREIFFPGTCFKKRDFATFICGGVFFCVATSHTGAELHMK